MFFRGFPTHLQWITAFNKKFKIKQKNRTKKDQKRVKKYSKNDHQYDQKRGALKIGKRKLICDFSKYLLLQGSSNGP